MTDPTPLPGLDDPTTVETEQGRPRVPCRDCGEPLTATDSRRCQLGPHSRRKHGIHAGVVAMVAATIPDEHVEDLLNDR